MATARPDLRLAAWFLWITPSASSLVELLSCDLVGGFCCGLIAGGDSFTGGANGSLQAGLHGHVALVGLLVGEKRASSAT